MNKALKIGFITMVLVYGSGLFYTYYADEKFNEKFELFDTNKNGIIDNEEINKDSSIILDRMSKRKTKSQIVMVLIPFSILIAAFAFAITFLIQKIKVINDNEIINSKNSQQ